MTARCLMIQGTASSVGKSLLTAAICRILKQDGLRVAPFKSQNMSLNSFITREGGEMGRAQVVQAEACGIEPHVTMNPILLKPTADQRSQVIVLGSVYDNLSATEYYKVRPRLRDTVMQAYRQLADEYDVIVIEGAGSPAEINLQADDLVNMGMAGMVDAPVLLVGDIDRGGVFASVAGTVWLLSEEDRRRIKGIVINKFRGDLEILRPGLSQLEELVSIPVLGVVPYLEVQIDEEDAATSLLERRPGSGESQRERESVYIDIVRLPRISNFTDFAALERQPGVVLRYVKRPEEIVNPDLVIIPGSKNTIGDLDWLRKSGIADRIVEHHRQDGCVMGVCGGYQMLGREIHDPFHTESDEDQAAGLGMLDVVTVFAEQKFTVQVRGEVLPAGCLLQGMAGVPFEGYEIHLGRSDPGRGVEPALLLKHPGGEIRLEGAVSGSGRVLGVYVHGFFDSPPLARGLLNNLRMRKGLAAVSDESIDPDLFKQREYDRLAAAVRQSLDLKKLYRIIGI